ncbi:MAG: IS3 family transposase [Bacteroidia bacterium]|nr:IS3 family transposase [Bacteroidia bacterium]MCZ2131042.1 IS3 family transposase [Bacteroidia bacterium]
MKNNFQNIGLAKLCSWLGMSRQAYYQNSWKAIDTTIEEELIIQQVKQIRQNHPRLGTRKLYDKLQAFMLENSIKMGRDALFNLLAANHLLIRKRKRRITTTNSYHWLRKYPNLIRNFVPTAPHQLWVSDITYWKINAQEHLYISFITDAYSHKIVGYQVAETLEAIESIQALQMALSAFEGAESHLQLTHHSDRGIQYCSREYVKLLQDNNIQISMTENGDPLENAIAERVNGIIKEEYLDAYEVNDIKEARGLLDRVIQLYNNDRPHLSISNLTPNQVHHSQNPLKTEKLWKNYYQKKTIFVNQCQD